MAKFTDVFIRKPVMASVLSLLVLLLGLRALSAMQIRQFPKIENTQITVTTVDPGATADVVSGFVTSPLEKSIASADGVDYITSSSTLGQSQITVFVKLNYDPEKAFTHVLSKVSEVRNQLPKSVEDPVIRSDSARGTALMYISFSSKGMTPEQITNYLSQVVQPKLQTVSGVSQAKILGEKTYSMRIWLNPEKMQAMGVTAVDVSNALKANNVQAAPGSTMSDFKSITLNANTGLTNVNDFRNIVVKRKNNDDVVHLGQIAKVQLGAEDYSFSVTFGGQQAVFMSINSTPEANPLTVIDQVRKVFPDIMSKAPPGLQGKIVYDATQYIRDSIHEVIETIVEASIIVILVILAFLGSLRTVLIPVVTIPLSLIGVCTFMLLFGFSINLLTLLAMVLAIGMVVDDAIVVVENVHRHLEAGLNKFDAAIIGAREIATPVISMSITLAAVFAPIGFMGGLTGALFTEFAFTLAGAVIISGFIALTLSPMLCSKVFTPEVLESKAAKFIDHVFEKIKGWYGRRLHSVLETPKVVVLIAVVVLSSCFYLYSHTKAELAPTEDQSAVFMMSTGPQYANLDYMQKYFKQTNDLLAQYPFMKDFFSIVGINGVNSAITGAIMKPWSERKISETQFIGMLQPKLNENAGLQSIAFPVPSLPSSGGTFPVDFVLTSTQNYKSVYKAAEKMLHQAQASGNFIALNLDVKYDNPQIKFDINRAKAQQLGISMSDIAQTLATGLSGGYTNLFELGGRSYKVIPELLRSYRGNVDKIAQLQVQTASGQLVPLSTFVHFTRSVQPSAINHFQQLNAVTIQGVPMPGTSIGQALTYLQGLAKNDLPKTISVDYGGQSRQYIKEGSALMMTFIFSIIIIFLVLSAQFESYRDPFIILIAVPMSICGALIPLNLGFASINIYTQIGLITLIGLISKHGILMVEFANKLREEGKSLREAIEEAAKIRLRAILMTTFAMIFGVIPLILATGAGAVSRFDMGLVIAFGMLIGTGFTLFIVPTMYMLLARRSRATPPTSSIEEQGKLG